MSVVFDDLASGNTTGIGRYTRTVARVLRDPLGRHTVRRVSELTTRFALRSPLEAALTLPSLLEREGTDLFHTGLFSLPPTLPCPAVVTLHDAIPVTHPELTDPAFAEFFARAAYPAIERAARVVCPTQHAADRVAEACSLPRSRVCVVPEAPAGCFRPAPAGQVAALLAHHGLQAPYVLVVGSLEARKDPTTILRALSLLPLSIRAVFVGPHAGFPLEAKALELHVRDRVHALGYCSDAELACLYSGALALVTASLAEGFGLPVVEAFACSTPLVATNATALPEVVGDAGLLFEPGQADQLAEHVTRLLDDPLLAAELRERGAERLAEHYSLHTVREAFRALYDDLTPLAKD